MAAGFLKLGKFIRIVPHPVMLGFVNGLAVVILLAQLGSFQTLGDQGTMVFLSGSRLWLMLGLVAITMAIIAFLPRLTKVGPSSLAAILLVSGVAYVVNSDTAADVDQPRPLLTVGDMLYSSTGLGGGRQRCCRPIRLVCRKGSPRCFGRCAPDL